MADKKDSVDVLERLSAHAGMVIIEEGDVGNCAYLIQSGRVRVSAVRHGKQVELAQMGAGEIFGEMSLIANNPRNATVEAMIDSNLIVLTQGLIEKKLNKSDPTIRALLPMLMRRLEQTNNELLSKAEKVDGLVNIAKNMYDKISVSLPASQKKTLENIVKPKLDDFISAIQSFQEKYKDNNTQ
jgi:CRP/FNR family cyclic AMP-dependent transcriptional regulator